ncbi:PTS glucose transporter subunit IIA [Streptomyces sp. ACA25]|uniref:PTS sugar transporter subunit IIA n=1 Tax=Streptomyces sp. ACA25 TaxID=3022596 RepID=UPI002307A193|nr:PTS glucose transporter subunit IIA [Streptomyces sp. ACA25]MDB1089377.1 PTS glucose transporter subunit IIA [Streptomyces sp. ACA25]
MTTVSSPLAGRAIGLDCVPDPVFSVGMVGPGTAVDPVREPCDAVAPVDGVLVSFHPHAFVIVDGKGPGILTHLGIDTVQLGGAGFELLAAKGDTVRRGQALVHWNPAAVRAAGKSPVVPVVALETPAAGLSEVARDTDVKAGDRLFLL